MVEEKKQPAEPKTAFGRRLKEYGKWADKVNMDRFLTLAFLTAAEKQAFCDRVFGVDADAIDYVDGEDVQAIVLKPEAEQRSVPEEQFSVKANERIDAQAWDDWVTEFERLNTGSASREAISQALARFRRSMSEPPENPQK